MKKILLLAVSFMLIGGFTAGVASAETKIGYVDVQKALNLSEAGKEAKEQLAARVKKFQDEINAKQEELKKLKDELEKQSVILSDTKRAEKEKDYSQKLKDFQRFTKDAQDELQGRDEELTKKILASFESVVQDFGRANGYTLIVVRTEALMYADEKADLTDELVRRFNATRKK